MLVAPQLRRHDLTLFQGVIPFINGSLAPNLAEYIHSIVPLVPSLCHNQRHTRLRYVWNICVNKSIVCFLKAHTSDLTEIGTSLYYPFPLLY